MCQHVQQGCNLLTSRLPNVKILQRAQENTYQGMQWLEMEIQGLRSRSYQERVLPGSRWAFKILMKARILQNLKAKINRLRSQIARLGQAFQYCRQTMVSISVLEALKDSWNKDVGLLSIQNQGSKLQYGHLQSRSSCLFGN